MPIAIIVTIICGVYRFRIEKKKWTTYVLEYIYALLVEGTIYLIAFLFIYYFAITNE